MGSYCLYAHGFRFYFTPLTAVLFTFPSRYLFTIGRQLVFSLTPWSAQIHTEFHVFRITQGHPRLLHVFKHRTFTFFGRAFQTLYSNVPDTISEPYNPGGKATGLGCSAFARHYLRNRIRFLFLRLLRCFTSPGIACPPLYIRGGTYSYDGIQVTPFGNPRIIA